MRVPALTRLPRAPLGLIVAVGPAGVIGRDGGLPWRSPEDLAHFKATTSGHAVIMGRRTVDSLPGPLPGRRIVAVTADRSWQPPANIRVTITHTIDAAIDAAREADGAPIVAGGAIVYASALRHVTDLWWTEIDASVATGHAGTGDVTMPSVPWDDFELLEERHLAPGVTARHHRRRRWSVAS